MCAKPKFDYVVKKSSFKKTTLYEKIDSENVVKNINNSFKDENVNSPFDRLLSIYSLQGLTVDLIDKLDPKIQYIQVKSWQHTMSDAFHTKSEYIGDGKGGTFESREDYCESSCIYTREELKQIIRKIEEIEKGTEGLDDLTKTEIIYNRLKRNISYDYETSEKESFYTRSLRGLIYGKTVCAGYVTILQHILQRQGIECKYVDNNKNHAWNVVVINGKQYGLDLTWDSQLYYHGKRGMDSMQYFGANVNQFKSKHDAKNNIGMSNYNDINEFGDNSVTTGLRFDSLYSNCPHNKATHVLSRKDGTQFYIAEVGSVNIPDESGKPGREVYKYIYIPIKDNKLDYSKARMVCSGTSLIKLNDGMENAKADKNMQLYNKINTGRDCFINEIMSEENINKSIYQEDSLYLGRVAEVNNNIEVEKDKVIQSNQNFKPRAIRVRNGKIIEQRSGNNIYRYDCYTVNNDLSADKHGFFSETDLYNLPTSVAEQFFDVERMEDAEFKDGGYMGKIDQNGQIVKDPQRISYYRRVVGIKERN